MPVIIPPAAGSTSSVQTVPTQQVFDYLLDSQGRPIARATVAITLGAANATTITPQVELSSVLVRVTTDANGFWSANLIPNANINPSGTTYLVQPPGLDAYSISIPSAGGPFQSTSPAVLVNVPGVLAPATTGITGTLTISGNETVSGTLTVAGTTTLAGTTTAGLTTGAASIGGDLSILASFRLLMLAATSKLVPGATSFSIRNHADGADNLLVTDAGDVTIRNSATITTSDVVIAAGRLLLNAAAARIKGGATSLSFRNNADSADNLLLTDAGNATLRGTLTTSTTNFHAEVYRNAAFTIVNGFVWTVVPFDSLSASGDPNSNFNTGTGVYTCPAPGRYRVTSRAQLSGVATSGFLGMTISKNGASDTKRMGDGQGGSNQAAFGSSVIRCAQSDTLAVQLAQNTATTPASLFTGEALLYASFEYLGP